MFKETIVTISDLGCDPITIQTGVVAKQASGSVIITQGETVVLAAAVANEEPKEGADFLPLMIDYREQSYAAGKIPGGFFKRQGRPTTKETITARLIDRPLRPLFPEGYTFDTQIQVSVLSYDGKNSPEPLGVIGASAALTISDIPFNGPVACARICLLEGQYLVNPSPEQRDRAELEVVIAGTGEGICMVESRADHVAESAILEALARGHAAVRQIVQAQKDLASKCGKAKRVFSPIGLPGGLVEECDKVAGDAIRAATTIKAKLESRDAAAAAKKKIKDHFKAKLESGEVTRGHLAAAYEAIVEKYVRHLVLDEGKRYDGRGFKDVRPIHCATGVLPRTHGSALFTRGETQALAIVTLGVSDDEQIVEGLEEEYRDRFMLHYNFPSYSVGEVRPIRGPGRREIGHGELAKKALESVIPAKDAFPYTVRVVAEILESNGSSSMATVCSSSLAMMDAGVPTTGPISGVAMGLMKEGEKCAVLTDIAGPEDHYGDMDFKVAGSERGVTALQMDIKISNVTVEIMGQALEQAREGRLHILAAMNSALPKAREAISKYAPRIFAIPIKPDKIGMVIGPGGKTIRGITEATGCKIDIDDDRNFVNVVSTDETKAQQAKEMVLRIIEDPEIGKIYQAKVVKITNFGCFCEILPAHEGLVHISELDFRRVRRVDDICQVGDVFPAKVMHIDDTGRISLSRKEALREMGQGEDSGGHGQDERYEGAQSQAQAHGEAPAANAPAAYAPSGEGSAPAPAPADGGAQASEGYADRGRYQDRPGRQDRSDRGDRPQRPDRGGRFGRPGRRGPPRGARPHDRAALGSEGEPPPPGRYGPPERPTAPAAYAGAQGEERADADAYADEERLDDAMDDQELAPEGDYEGEMDEAQFDGQGEEPFDDGPPQPPPPMGRDRTAYLPPPPPGRDARQTTIHPPVGQGGFREGGFSRGGRRGGHRGGGGGYGGGGYGGGGGGRGFGGRGRSGGGQGGGHGGQGGGHGGGGHGGHGQGQGGGGRGRPPARRRNP